MADIFSKYFPN